MPDRIGKKNFTRIMSRHDQNKMDLDGFMKTHGIQKLSDIIEYASAMTKADVSVTEKMVGHMANFAVCELIEKHYNKDGTKKIE